MTYGVVPADSIPAAPAREPGVIASMLPMVRLTLVVALPVLAAGLAIYGLTITRTPISFDDAAFYFKYVEPLSKGWGWRFNGADPPVWGASAPLWPLLLAIPRLFGVLPEVSSVHLSFTLTAASMALLAYALNRKLGWAAAVAVGAAFAVNSRAAMLATQGLESPLSYFVVALCFWAALDIRKGWAVGLIAGLAMINKVDMAPMGVFLLAAVAVRDRRIPWAAIASGFGVAALWYAFAWWHFGSPLPNSFVTKFGTSLLSPLKWNWFIEQALLHGVNKYLLVISALGLLATTWRVVPIWIVGWGLLVAQTAGYAYRVPMELYIWYCAPAQLTLCVLAAASIGQIAHRLAGVAPKAPPVIFSTAALAIGLAALIPGYNDGWGTFVFYKNWLNNYEGDRVAAGRWVEANTRPDITLLTGFGSPAYYSHRYVYDYSYLNRRYDPTLGRDFNAAVARFRPDALIQCPAGSGVNAAAFAPPPGYTAIKTFDGTQRRGVGDFFCVVLVTDPMRVLNPAGVGALKPPRYDIGTPIRFNHGGNAERYEKAGWSGAEPNHTWTAARVVKLHLTAYGDTSRPLLLRISGLSFIDPNMVASQRIQAFVNGQQVGEQTATAMVFATYAFPIPHGVIADGQAVELELRFPDAVAPVSKGGADPRPLGMAVTDMSIAP